MSTIEVIVTYDIVTCYKADCGITWGMEATYNRERRQDHGNFHCPNGHAQHYTGKSDAEKAKEAQALAERRLEWERSARRAAEDQAQAAERSNRALKGVVTKTKRRVASGVCPVPGCKRHFADLQRHIGSKHPDYSTAQEH